MLVSVFLPFQFSSTLSNGVFHLYCLADVYHSDIAHRDPLENLIIGPTAFQTQGHEIFAVSECEIDGVYTLRCMDASAVIHVDASRIVGACIVAVARGMVAVPCTVLEIRPSSNHVSTDRRTVAPAARQVWAVSIQGVTGDLQATTSSRTPEIQSVAPVSPTTSSRDIIFIALPLSLARSREVLDFPVCSLILRLRHSGSAGLRPRATNAMIQRDLS